VPRVSVAQVLTQAQVLTTETQTRGENTFLAAEFPQTNRIDHQHGQRLKSPRLT
jgi:hypothetical protein